MKRGFEVIAAALALAALTVPAQAQPTQSLDRAIGASARDSDFSGVILVTERGRARYRSAFGLADRAFAVPATPDTRYRVGSVTKLFTAVLILQLAQEGRLSLDVPIRSALPDYPGDGGDRVTIHQLLNHSSGIAQWDTVSSYQEAFANGLEKYQRPLTPEAQLRLCCSGPLQHPPGEAFVYNNADYFVLGRIVERLTAKSFEDALAERILRPLGLASTGMLHWDRIVPALAPTYFWRDDRRVLIPDMPVYFENWYAAAGMYSSAADLATFADALYGGRLLRPEMLQRLLTPGLDDYGYGLWSYSVTRAGRSWRVAKRPGSVMGANAVLYRLLDRDVSIVLLANTNRADLDVLAQRIADVLIREASASPPDQTRR
jgi:CubicO group peptidase (beta-lactamase class C family)